MKYTNLFPAAFILSLLIALTGCEKAKELIIIDGNLPIKTSTLYMVGDATPNGWNIDAPTPLEANGEDPLVFTWEGELYTGEMKLCLTPGSWDAPFIRPVNNGTAISKTDITDAVFDMHAGDPDSKWKITDAGVYSLTFDLRNWTMSTVFVRDLDGPTIEPIETDAFYMVGDATPNGWNIDDPTQLEKQSDFIFVYEGELTVGELKCCTSTGSFDVPFVRPATDGCAISKSGVESDGFVYSTSPDYKWKVTEEAVYRLTFDLKEWTISAVFVKDIVHEKNPIETEVLYMIGDATPGGWSMDDACEFTVDPNDKYIFSWEGELVQGSMKACLERDGNFSCPFIRPESDGCQISADGVESPDFVFTKAPDYQWHVVEAGRYHITFDLRDWTIDVRLAGSEIPDVQPIETETLYMIGDATPGGWSMDDATEFTVDPSDKYIFTWEGELKEGELKMCLERDGTFSCPFIRPASNGCKISATGIEATDFVFYANDPDNKWAVTDAGRYRITLDLRHRTIATEFMN